MTLRLQPEALGQVQIRIDTPATGPVRVEITVERPETLALLQHDQPQLARALDQAGIPADGRSVTFHIEPAAPSGSGGGGNGSLPSFTGSFAGDGASSGNAPGQQGTNSGGNGGSGGGSGSGPGGSGAAQDGEPAAPEPRWQSVGLDITA